MDISDICDKNFPFPQWEMNDFLGLLRLGDIGSSSKQSLDRVDTIPWLVSYTPDCLSELDLLRTLCKYLLTLDSKKDDFWL